MARNMSFSLTTEQMREGTKTVTRRTGWWKDKHGRRLLRKGDIVNACVKCMGLKPGEKVERIGQIKVVSVTREPLAQMAGTAYGKREAGLEGFPDMDGEEFVQMFCKHMGVQRWSDVTRIEFEHLPDVFLMKVHREAERFEGAPDPIPFPNWWRWLEQRAQRNHSQTLQRLHDRGGLDYCEAAAILGNTRYMNRSKRELRQFFQRVAFMVEHGLEPKDMEREGLI